MGTLLGASWKSMMIGFIAAVVNYLASLGPNLPATPADWGHVLMSAAIAALGLVVKDFNVSNAPKPVTATAVSPVEAEVPKPPVTVKPATST